MDYFLSDNIQNNSLRNGLFIAESLLSWKIHPENPGNIFNKTSWA